MKGIEIKALRERFGFTQAAFSDILGVSQGTISRWERIEEPPVEEGAVRLLKVFAAVADTETVGHQLHEARLLRGGLYAQYLLLVHHFEG